MSSLKEIDDIQVTKTALYQLIDIVQNDISGSATRRKYPMFVSSSNDGTITGEYSITSSLFQTVYDQDYTLQVANPIFDITFGLYSESDTVQNAKIGEDSTGKLLFNSSSAMMREKIDIYNLHLSKLRGPEAVAFYAPFDVETEDTRIDEAIFIDFKRLFFRDRLKSESFAMRFYTSASLDGSPYAGAVEQTKINAYTGSNISKTSEEGQKLYTDIRGSSTSSPSIRIEAGGEVGLIRDADETGTNRVGLIYYDAGVVVLDAKKVMWGEQHVSGTISETTSSVSGINTTMLGSGSLAGSNPSATFIPDFVVSSSIDDIVTHIASCRFSSGSFTGITFQNQTTINSTLVFCRATADEFNYSSNPTYTDEDGQIVVIDDPAGTLGQKSFTYPTTVGLYDDYNNLLAVAKFSRPIEKNYEKDLTIRVRLDF